MLNVLFLCTGNSARSQMAEAILNSKGKNKMIAVSAGSNPAEKVNPYAIAVMKENGIDISDYEPKSIDFFADTYFDFVITLCDNAKNHCPTIPSPSKHLHWSFPDPKYFEGNDDEILKQFRKISRELYRRIELFVLLPLEKSDKVIYKQKLDEILSEIESNHQYI